MKRRRGGGILKKTTLISQGFPFSRAVRIAEDLLRHNASVDLKGSWIGDTALMNAASGGGVEIGRLLLENNAEAGIKNKLGETALDHAKRWNHPEFVKLLGEY